MHKSELITRRADDIIEIQLYVRVNLDIESDIKPVLNIRYPFNFQSSTLRVENSMNFSG